MKIKMSDEVSVDLDKLIDSRAMFLANSGGGKSWAGRRFIEQAFGKKQIIIIDPEGEFGNLRQEFDFVYIAKDGGDAPAEVRSAALLAKRLLETKANAIIDIYELGSERSAFVKAFFDACVNMPKDLWQDCFFILDEAHKFAPEKGQGESVALQSVIDMASLGRKRGYCLIPMTQRPAKLSKDVVAECNNKFIGRASLDLDRERSAKELGFRTKEDILSLRDLEPGEFYVFGPAISRHVIKTTIGDVKIKPPKRGGRKQRVAPPTARVKSILSKLKDLPQEALKEAQTIAELQKELRQAKSDIVTLRRVKEAPAKTVLDTKAIEKAVEKAVKERDSHWTKIVASWQKSAIEFHKIISEIGDLLRKAKDLPTDTKPKEEVIPFTAPAQDIRENSVRVPHRFKEVKVKVTAESTSPAQVGPPGLGEGERKILAAVGNFPHPTSREHLTVLTGYKRSTRDKYLYLLATKGFVEDTGDGIRITAAGDAELGPVDPLPVGRELAEHYIKTLPEGEAMILQFLLKQEVAVSREQISEATNYQRSTRDKYIYLLRVRQLVSMRGNLIKISDHLL